jgi:TPR repeat protein
VGDAFAPFWLLSCFLPCVCVGGGLPKKKKEATHTDILASVGIVGGGAGGEDYHLLTTQLCTVSFCRLFYPSPLLISLSLSPLPNRQQNLLRRLPLFFAIFGAQTLPLLVVKTLLWLHNKLHSSNALSSCLSLLVQLFTVEKHLLTLSPNTLTREKPLFILTQPYTYVWYPSTETMSIPATDGIGKARWTQGADEETGLELRIPFTLPDGVRSRELTVEIKDKTILCVSHKDTCILQWRLYAAVKDEVEWRVDEGKTLVVELEKVSGAPWSCLLDLPMRDDDELLTTLTEINGMFRNQLPMLPSPQEEKELKKQDDATAKSGGEDGKEGGEDDDLDKLLDEAAKEVAGKEGGDGEEAEEGTAAFIKAELENYRVEEEVILQKLAEIDVALANPTETAETAKAREQKSTLMEMLSLHNECRALRSQPSTLENFLKCTQLDLQKARANIGEAGANEEEKFESDDERALTATELMTCGLKFFEDQDIRGCLHFLRLAAIHHKHEQSTLLLYNVYSQLGSPRGAFLLMKRALDDSEPSAMVNQRVGELYDQGERHFLPLFPAAVYFYQRAAKLGHVNAMLSLAQLWLRGATASSMLSEEEVEAQKSITKYHAWLQKAMDRGCGSAYFVRACMHIKGEHGMAKSYKDAKEYMDAAAGAQPEILQRAPQVVSMLENLRKEEEGSSADAVKPSAGASSGGAVASASASKVAAPKAAADDDVGMTSSMARFNALSNRSTRSPAGSAVSASRADGGVLRTKKTLGGGSRNKVFWERACVTGFSVYSLYALSFPIRVALLPFFYSVISGIVEAIPWLANRNVDASMF